MFGKRLCIIIALYHITSKCPELIDHINILNTLCHCDQPDTLRQPEDKVQNRLILLNIPLLCHTFIQFQNINRKLTKHIQGRISCSKVIHFYLKSCFSKSCYLADYLFRVLCIGRLGYFHMNIPMRNFIAVNQSANILHQIFLFKITA